MKNLEKTLRTLTIGVTSTLLAGCEGASPIATPVVPMRHRKHG
ncbi:MAG: hypothetical protein WA742_04915 [Candidatus Cybelea sp.]|jgi:hypothetical protein